MRRTHNRLLAALLGLALACAGVALAEDGYKAQESVSLLDLPVFMARGKDAKPLSPTDAADSLGAQVSASGGYYTYEYKLSPEYQHMLGTLTFETDAEGDAAHAEVTITGDNKVLWEVTLAPDVPVALENVVVIGVEHLIITFTAIETGDSAAVIRLSAPELSYLPGTYILGTIRVKGKDAANLREADNQDAPIVEKVQGGTVLDCVGVSDEGWFHVLLPDGRLAYIAPKMASFTSTE